ncbi:hypothetical protein [Patiriisocius sp. Uisw_017]|uniref:hypothetical protein n=1 Tax=Patiriisocius sp. Uisw_017 TaxID=3230968 RepID=UPI0039ECCE30
MDYLAHFSDKALPSLDKNLQTVAQIKENQNEQFLPDHDIKADLYIQHITYKKVAFKKKWERKNWLAWNWAEYRAYAKLFEDSKQ